MKHVHICYKFCHNILHNTIQNHQNMNYLSRIFLLNRIFLLSLTLCDAVDDADHFVYQNYKLLIEEAKYYILIE